MGWIVADVMRRVRSLFGSFRALDWRSFLELIGLRCRRDADLAIPALFYQGTILVRPDLDDWITAWLVWHEIGHFLLHAGNQLDWLQLPCGDLILAKQERQAAEFALHSPD